jgi:hypothetical protein
MKKMMTILLISCSVAMLGSVTRESTECRSKDPVFKKDSVSKIESVDANVDYFTIVANDVAPVMVSDEIVAGSKEIPASNKALLKPTAIAPDNLRIRYGLAKTSITHTSINSKARFRDSNPNLSLNYRWQFGSYLRC